MTDLGRDGRVDRCLGLPTFPAEPVSRLWPGEAVAVTVDVRAHATHANGRSTVDRTTDRTSDRTRPDVDALIVAKDETIAGEREEIDYLRDQLDHNRRELAEERRRFDVIHREGLGRIEALTAGGIDGKSEAPRPENGAPGPVRDATSAPETSEPDRESLVGSVWRRLFGGG